MRTVFHEFNGEQHPFCYSLDAVIKTIDAFGTLEHFSEIVSADDTAEMLKALATMTKILLDGGRAYYTEIGQPLPKEINNPAVLISGTDRAELAALVRDIMQTIKTDTERTVEASAPKNAETLTREE